MDGSDACHYESLLPNVEYFWSFLRSLYEEHSELYSFSAHAFLPSNPLSDVMCIQSLICVSSCFVFSAKSMKLLVSRVYRLLLAVTLSIRTSAVYLTLL